MIDKIWPSADEAVADIPNGALICVGGFGGTGVPDGLLEALSRRAVRNLVAVSNNAGAGEDGLTRLVRNSQLAKVICSFPTGRGRRHFEDAYEAGEIMLELVPQGTLAERIRAAGAGIPAFYTPTGAGTVIAEGKETRELGGRECLLEHAIRSDFALVRAHKADRMGNLVYRKSMRNFNPIMAMAGKVTIAEVNEIVPVGELDPEHIVTPGIFVHRVVKRVAT